jgi:DNA-binding transcriptional MerR regulator
MKMIYTVGEMAKKLNVAASTLRYYDKEGMLPFVERSSGGIRMFKDEDLAGLKMIECLKKTGMPIKNIKHFMDCSISGDSTIDERYSIIQSQRDSVIQQIQEMQEMLEMLNFKCWYYETAKAAGTCAIHDHDHLQLKEIPEEYHKFINVGRSI